MTHLAGDAVLPGGLDLLWLLGADVSVLLAPAAVALADEIDAELEEIAQQSQLASADELLAAIAENGMTEDQARNQVEMQVLVEKLVEDEDGGTTPSEKELRAIYAQAKEQAAGQQGQKIPPYAQVRDQIAEQAKTEQVGKVAQTLLEDLRKDADITINL